MRDISDGLKSYITALKLVRKLKLWPYLILPGIISLLLGAILVFGASKIGSEVADFISLKYPWEFGAGLVRRVGKFVSQLIIWAGAIMVYKYVILILASPFMSPLSEKVENYLRGDTHSNTRFSVSRAFKEMLRGVRISIRNIVRELFFTILILIAGFIPVIGMLSSIGIFLVQAYYAGFGNLDYTLERHFGVKDSVEFVRDYKGLSVANGSVFLLMLTIPVLGLFIAPSLATIAGTIDIFERLEYEERVV